MEEKLELDAKREEAKEARALPGEMKKVVRKDPEASITPYWDEDDEEKLADTLDMKLNKRADEILHSVWIEYDTRMYTKSTSKAEFLAQNRPMALELARKEYDEEQAKLAEKEVRESVYVY